MSGCLLDQISKPRSHKPRHRLGNIPLHWGRWWHLDDIQKPKQHFPKGNPDVTYNKKIKTSLIFIARAVRFMPCTVSMTSYWHLIQKDFTQWLPSNMTDTSDRGTEREQSHILTYVDYFPSLQLTKPSSSSWQRKIFCDSDDAAFM